MRKSDWTVRAARVSVRFFDVAGQSTTLNFDIWDSGHNSSAQQ